jgi:hypothetical protein
MLTAERLHGCSPQASGGAGQGHCRPVLQNSQVRAVADIQRRLSCYGCVFRPAHDRHLLPCFFGSARQLIWGCSQPSTQWLPVVMSLSAAAHLCCCCVVWCRRVVSDAALATVATAACLHLAGGDKDFRVTAPSLNFPDAWGADLVMQVRCNLGLAFSNPQASAKSSSFVHTAFPAH